MKTIAPVLDVGKHVRVTVGVVFWTAFHDKKRSLKMQMLPTFTLIGLKL